ncbi:hypothetical protein ACE6H2_025789 [Prunus campanulata]
MGLGAMAMGSIQVPRVHMPPPLPDFRPRAILVLPKFQMCTYHLLRLQTTRRNFATNGQPPMVAPMENVVDSPIERQNGRSTPNIKRSGASTFPAQLAAGSVIAVTLCMMGLVTYSLYFLCTYAFKP